MTSFGMVINGVFGGTVGASSLLAKLLAESGSTAPRGLRRLLAGDAERTGLAKRRFPLPPGHASEILAKAERSGILGYQAALTEQPHLIGLLAPDQRGFAWEGAATACVLLDLAAMNRGRRLHELLAGPARRHPHAVYLGAGRAYARLPLRPGFAEMHPLHRWTALDGLGFQHAVNRAGRTADRFVSPRLRDRAEQALADQGTGRFLWLRAGADPARVADDIRAFPAPRRGDLWSGVGFAAATTGGADHDGLELLHRHASGDGLRTHLAQGSAFAATTWLRAGHLPEWAERAVPLLTGTEAAEAAARAERALANLGCNPHTIDDYLDWRELTRCAFTRHG